MSVYHQAYTLLLQKRLHAFAPFPGISTDMGKKHLHSLHLKNLEFGAFTAHHSMVDITTDGPDYRTHILKPLHYGIIAYVTGMPNLVAILKMLRIAIVPAPMSVAQDSYSLHYFYIICQNYQFFCIYFQVSVTFFEKNRLNIWRIEKIIIILQCITTPIHHYSSCY